MLATLLLGLSLASAEPPPAAVAASAVRPLLLGSAMPTTAVEDIEGQATDLQQAAGGKPALVVFYRGGWCPYCMTQLSGLRLIFPELRELGFALIAVSPDRPAKLRETLEQHPLEYTLLSDHSAELARAFGVAFQVDAATQAQLREYGIDLEEASGESHGLLPVPGVFLIDREGRIQFTWVHPDYRVRAPESVILAAARALAP